MSLRVLAHLALALTPASHLAAQDDRTAAAIVQERPAAIMDSLAPLPYGAMKMLFEVTFMKIDVLTLEVRLGTADAARAEALIGDREYSNALADSIATLAILSQDAWSRMKFERNTSFGRFLGGTDDNMRKALEAGIVDSATYRFVAHNMPVWYAFLEERGIEDGDEVLYRISGDTLHVQYYGIVENELLLDQVDVGERRRLSVLGSYFAPGSNFRKKLIKSLFERDE